MSEPESDSERVLGLSRAEWAFRGAGAAMLAAGLGAAAAFEQATYAMGGWVLALTGLAIAVFGQRPAPRIVSPLSAPEPTTSNPASDAPDESTSSDDAPRAGAGRWGPRQLLATGSGAIVVLGLGWLLSSVYATERASGAFYTIVLGTVGLVVAAIWEARGEPANEDLRIELPRNRKTRNWILAGVGIALLVQLAIPLRYYFGEDRFDERFAWRMFSAVRVYRCNLDAFDIDHGVPSEVNLSQTIHVGWRTMLQRNREDVMQRYLSWRCETTEHEEARLVNECISPEGERVPAVIRHITCADGRIVAPVLEAP